jgi:RNA polymerase sigma-70 factor (ECF subfamily)
MVVMIVSQAQRTLSDHSESPLTCRTKGPNGPFSWATRGADDAGHMRLDDPDELVDRARQGDGEAIGQLWRELNPRLLRYLAARGAPAPEDLAAEVWVEVVAKRGRVEGGAAGFRRFVFTVARHRLVDEFRRAARRPEVLGEPPDGAGAPGPAADLDPEATTLAREGLERALALFRRLPADQAEALLLRVLAGLDVAATAEVMGRPAGSVRVLTHRGLRALQRELVTESRPRSEIGLS